jgi:uncharacterized protein (DUF1684 family)
MSPALVVTTAVLAASPGNLEEEIKAWREQRAARLTSEDGWLTLVGLHWLKPGENRFGSAKDNDLVFPEPAPPHAGTFMLRGDTVTLAPAAGVTFLLKGRPFPGGALRNDAAGEPDVLTLGRLHFHVIKRGDKLGIRVKDPEAEARKKFHPIPTYPTSAAWRFEARFEPAATPRTLAVPNVLGQVEELPSPGTAVFTVNGKEQRLDPVVEPGDDQLFFIFGDETNRTETYGAGRFLYAPMPKDGRVVLDFNKAYNPPCAFTPYATCPLPPPQNKLRIRIEAGEKRYGNH